MKKEPVTAVVVCNGEFHDAEHTAPLIQRADLVIAADGGARHLALLDLIPDVIVGDMDSLLDPELMNRHAGVEVVRYPRRKDKTDTQLAVELAQERGARRVLLLAAFGGRPDHVLGHISLLSRFPGVLEILENGTRMRALKGETMANIDVPTGGLVSLVPFPEARGVITGGLEFPLNRESLTPGTRGISNRVSGAEAWVRVKAGCLILCSSENLCDHDESENEI